MPGRPRRIDRPRYLCCAAFYAVLNPTAARIFDHPRQFVWSSYRETAGLVSSTGLVRPAQLLTTFDEDPERARELYIGLVDEAVACLGRKRAEEAWWKAVERGVGETLATETVATETLATG
jgi:hypothetical protein